MDERKPGISSALGSVSHSRANDQPRRVLTVNDEEDVPVRSFSAGSFDQGQQNLEDVISQEELEQLAQNREQLQNSRKQSHQQKNRIPEGIKLRLEILTGIGRLSEDVKVDGVTFSIRSLKPIENEEIVRMIAGIELGGIQAFELRAQTLARAVYKIDGQDIDFVIDAKSVDDRVNFMKNVLEESLANFLYVKYRGILNKNSDKFSELGKTEAEVIENVKKS
jgi:hypothetical protein